MWFFAFLALSLHWEKGSASSNLCLLRSAAINASHVEQCLQADRKTIIARIGGRRPLTETYANLWLKCALPKWAKVCDDYSQDVSMPDIYQFGMDTSDMILMLLQSWIQRGGAVSEKCIENFKLNKASLCLLYFQSVPENHTEPTTYSGEFVGCVLSTLNGCDETSKMDFAINILKYVKQRRLLEENKRQLDYCLNAVSKDSLDGCFDGFYDVMESVVKSNHKISTSMKKGNMDNDCLALELLGCSNKALKLIKKIGKYILRVPLTIGNNVQGTAFDRKGKLRPRRESDDDTGKEYDSESDDEFDYVQDTKDDEEGDHEELADYHEDENEQEAQHLVDMIVDHGNNDDPAATISPKSNLPEIDYSDVELQVQLEPPYNLPGDVIQHMEECMNLISLTKMEYCCPGSTDFMTSLIHDAPMSEDVPIETRSCSFTCFSVIIRNCSSEDQDLMKIMYEGMIDFYATGDVGGKVEPVEGDIVSPHHVPPHMIEHLQHCYRRGLRHKYHQCCPGISTVFNEILKHNYTLSNEVSPRTCNIICIAEIVNFFCDAEAEDTFLKITFGIIADYYKNNPVDKPENYGNILHIPPEPPYALDEEVFVFLYECYRMIANKGFNKCCYGITDVFVTLLNDEPWPASKINPHNCNIFCLEELVGSSCDSGAVDPFRKLTYSILAHYSSDKYNKLVPKDPWSKRPPTAYGVYYLSAPIKKYLQKCFTVPLAAKYHICCPGIAHVLDAILSQEAWPEGQVTLDKCNVFCVHAIAVSECTPDSSDAFRILLHDITQHYVDEKKFLEKEDLKDTAQY